MAHLANIGALTDELIAITTSVSTKSDTTRFNVYKESALRGVRNQSHPRTNQFDVASQLEGLEEKFRVYNEDPLADALKERLEKLSKFKFKWAAEVLHLLLELSDKPVFNSRIEDLDFLKAPEPDPAPTLQWKDLIAEDPLLREKNVWRNIDFGAESSDAEDDFEDSRSELSKASEVTGQSSLDEDYAKKPGDFVLEPPDSRGIQQLRDAQFWLKTPSVGGVRLETVKRPITELQAVREVLFMLAGLPTSLFKISKSSLVITPCKIYTLKHASTDAFYNLLETWADQGSAVSSLRSWANRVQSIPLLQAFQSSILRRLDMFNALLTRVHQRYVAPAAAVVVSLIQIQAELTVHLRQLIRVSDITRRVDEDPYAHAFRYLEILYDETCTSQMAGDDDIYTSMGEIFFECFQVYLRPLRTWMEQGELAKGDTVFFVAETSGNIVLASLWQSRFKLRMTQSGVIHAPNFIQAVARKVFTAGKSVVLLKHLNRFHILHKSGMAPEPHLEFESVCQPSMLQLAPFAELFDAAFNEWVQVKLKHSSSLLRQTLYDSGLQKSLDILSHVYFMDEGSTAAVFASSMFDKLDTLNSSWNDQFTLTELAQSTFGSLPSVLSDRLKIFSAPLPRKYQDVTKCRRSVKTLSTIQFKYLLSWPIQTILIANTIPSYQRICTFLFQIRRSSHILSRQRTNADKLTKSNNSDERALYYSIRHRLTWFTQTLYYYLTSLIIEPNSRKMRDALKEAADVDAMIEVHSNYIRSTINQALLGSKLELIHKTILSILDLAIKLQDAQAANAVANQESLDQQQGMMDLSMASLGLHTPQRNSTTSRGKANFKTKAKAVEPISDEEDIGVDFSILSSTYESPGEDISYINRLRTMKADFDRLVRFVASGLKGVARVGTGQESRGWDTLGEMLEGGLGNGARGYSGR